MFFTGLFNTHLIWLETVCDLQGCDVVSFMELMRKALQYIVSFSELPEDSIFKMCVEFWHFFTEFLKNSEKNKIALAQNPNQTVLWTFQQNPTLNSCTYPKILSDVRRIIISRMAKPQEVIRGNYHLKLLDF
jgi:exportin-1